MPDTQARAPSAALDDQVVDAADHGQAVAEARHQVGDAGGVVGLLLDGGDGGRFQQFGHHVRRQVHAIAARVVVEQDLEARGLRHAAVEGDRLACVGLIGQAGKHHQAIHAQFLGFAGVGGGARRAGFRQPGDDRHAAARRFQRGAQHGQLSSGASWAFSPTMPIITTPLTPLAIRRSSPARMASVSSEIRFQLGGDGGENAFPLDGHVCAPGRWGRKQAEIRYESWLLYIGSNSARYACTR